MPPSGYLSASSIEACLQYLATTYPSMCQLIVTAEPSREGRTIRAVKIAAGSGADRRGVLFVGGTHARELINPDALVGFGLRLCQAYSGNTGLTFGGKSYDSGTVKLLVEALDIFILPLVNPDGREYVQAPSGNPWWRKNRSPNPGLACPGVDLNRNYDFLWSSLIGNTSGDPCDETFHGPSAFSEPETRNVRWMIDTNPRISSMMDVHSAGRLVLYPWGDDDAQTSNPSMNFLNPSYNGLRGSVGDTTYLEYIVTADRDWLTNAGNDVRDAIAAVNGNVYTVEQAVYLYPTCGTSKDYAYSRHLVDSSKRKVYAYTLETGTEFQPAFPGAGDIINEIMAGLVQFCIQTLCAVEAVAAGTADADSLEDLRAFRDRELMVSAAGRRLVHLLESQTAEALEHIAADPKLLKEARSLLASLNAVVGSRFEERPAVLSDQTIRAAKSLAAKLAKRGSPQLKAALTEGSSTLVRFRGKDTAAVVKVLERNGLRPRPRKPARKPGARRVPR